MFAARKEEEKEYLSPKHRVHGLPHDEVRALLKKRGVLAP
jgi:hypothetical protein